MGERFGQQLDRSFLWENAAEMREEWGGNWVSRVSLVSKTQSWLPSIGESRETAGSVTAIRGGSLLEVGVVSAMSCRQQRR